MPELPEVETITRALRPHLEGARILGVTTHVPRLRTPLDLEHRPELVGHRILALRRRAKYLIAELDGPCCLVLHLGMTGSFRIVPPATPLTAWEHVVWQLDTGCEWRFNDPRRFGSAELHPLPVPGGEPACLAGLGPEPLGPAFSGAALHAACAGRRSAIKPLLMDPRIVVGVGNIYASEALFRAGIRPQTPAGRLSHTRCDRLAAAIVEVLREAIAFGGTTLVNFKTVDGSEGRFRRRLLVYGRGDEPCTRCATGRIRRAVLGGRSTWWCPHCQH